MNLAFDARKQSIITVVTVGNRFMKVLYILVNLQFCFETLPSWVGIFINALAL